MCPSHLSESLLLDRLRYIVILSSAYRNQPSFSFIPFFFSPLLRLPTLLPSKNCLSALLLGYVYPVPHPKLVWCWFLTLVFSYVQKTCILTLVRNSRPVFVWTWYSLTLVSQGTLAKAWILWNSRRLRVIFKILCKSFFKSYSFHCEDVPCSSLRFLSQRRISTGKHLYYVSFQSAELVLCASIVSRSNKRGGARRCGIRGGNLSRH